MAALLAAAQKASLTYDDVGASRDAEMPSGYHHVRRRERIGQASSFDRAVAGLTHLGGPGGRGSSRVSRAIRSSRTRRSSRSRRSAPCAGTRSVQDRGRCSRTRTHSASLTERCPATRKVGEESFVVERRGGATFFTGERLLQTGRPAGSTRRARWVVSCSDRSRGAT